MIGKTNAKGASGGSSFGGVLRTLTVRLEGYPYFEIFGFTVDDSKDYSFKIPVTEFAVRIGNIEQEEFSGSTPSGTLRYNGGTYRIYEVSAGTSDLFWSFFN